MILVGIKLKSSLVKKISSFLIFSNPQKVSPFFIDCSLFECPSRSPVLHLYPRNVRILRVASPSNIVLTDREGSNWVLAVFQFIWE